MNRDNLRYISSLDYKDHEDRIHDLMSVLKELEIKCQTSRRLRYTELDIEGERRAGRLQPDELYIPQHIIDTNIRREQSAYIQYVTQSNRAVILSDPMVPQSDFSLLEKDLTGRLRYAGWQVPMFANIDSFQMHGYSAMEIMYDESKPGHVAHEMIQVGDFGFVSDTKDIQDSELVARSFYFSRTKLAALAESGKFDPVQVEKIIDGEPPSNYSDAVIDYRDKSLYRIEKLMFRVKGIVFVAWSCEHTCDDWLSKPIPLFIGRREPYTQQEQQAMMLAGQSNPAELRVGKEAKETKYPFVVFPYLISENNTISQQKGRVYLDQDCQEGASSLMSSFCTAHRRASQLYLSKDTDDPNADLVLQKNIYFEPGVLIPAKVKQFQLTAPDPDLMQAIMTVVQANQTETSQINFAVNNRKDSRKTATEVSAAAQSQAVLSTVQVVLFSTALTQLYGAMADVIRSRVLAGLIQDVSQPVMQQYARQWTVKPSGDTDVIERQQLVQTMMTAWPVVQQTPASTAFLCDLLAKMFPEQGQKYIEILQQAQQQQQSQQQQMLMGMAQQAAAGITKLADHPEFFSEVGRTHAYPVVEEAAQKIKQLTGTK